MRVIDSHQSKFYVDIFSYKNIKYDLRSTVLLDIPSTYTLTYGINLVRVRACLLWNSIPAKIQ